MNKNLQAVLAALAIVGAIVIYLVYGALHDDLAFLLGIAGFIWLMNVVND